MNRNDQRKITKNLVALRKAIQNDVSKIADRLCEENVFSNEEISDIENVKPKLPQLQCGMLINKLLRSGSGAFSKFKEILKELGHTSVIEMMEKTTYKCPGNVIHAWTEDKEKTFVIVKPATPKLSNHPELISEDLAESDDSDYEVRFTDGELGNDRRGQDSRLFESCAGSRIEEVHQLERMMTVVLTRLGEKENNNNTTTEWKREIRDKLKEESKGNEELIGFFKSLRYNSFSLTSQTIAH